MSAKQRVQRLLSLLAFFGGLCFYAPVALLVRTQRGITVSQFFILQVILSASILLFEIPAGVLSDRIGHQKTIVLSKGALLAARMMLLFAEDFWAFGVEAVVEGLAHALASGTQSAYLYGFMKGEEYTVFSAKVSRAGTVGFISSTLAYSVLLRLSDVRGLVAATCVTTVLVLIVACLLPEETERKAAQESPIETALKSRMKPTRMDVLFFAILSAISVAYLVVNFFYAVKVNRIGLPYEALTAVIFAYSALELLEPHILSRIRREGYPRAASSLLLACSAAFFAVWRMDTAASLTLMALLPLGMSIASYLIDELIQESIDARGLDHQRATVLSVLNMGNNVLEIAFLLLSAALSDNEGNIAFLLAAGYFALVGAAAGKLFKAHEAK